ncbi:MAG: cellulase family glycosylhydrolase [Actinomycetes bacterium]
MSVRRRLILQLLAAAALLLAPAAAAHAARNAEVSIMDDPLLLGRSQGHIDNQMRIFRNLGVDRVRVSAFWNGAAPNAGSKTKPAGFDGSNPSDPRYQWSALDRVVTSAAAHDLKVMLSITTPAPMWATTGRRRNNLWLPSVSEFADYAGAVAQRYASSVDHYGVSNEPNQGGWLQPQSDRTGLIAPHHYRAMVRAAYPRIKAADPSSTVLVGDLAPTGTGKRGRRKPIRPLAFLRAMACVNKHWRPTRRGRCRNFKPIPADAIAHHPYQFFLAPNRHSRNRDDAGIGDSRRFLRALDRLVRAHRIAPSHGRRLNVFYTEFGYQTDPPDPFAGVSLGRQSRWLQQAAYIAWRTPRIRAINQFRLTDGRIRGHGVAAFREFQSGLLFANRRKKPAYRTFANPFFISGHRAWGQVRPGGRHAVTLQKRGLRGGRFRRVRRVRTDRRGYFSVRIGARRGQWRYVYSDGPRGHSGTIRIR